MRVVGLKPQILISHSSGVYSPRLGASMVGFWVGVLLLAFRFCKSLRRLGSTKEGRGASQVVAMW